IGILAQEGGDVVDVIDDSAAWRAGIGPGMKIVKVDGDAWSPGALRRAVARNGERGLGLTVQNGAESFEARVDDAGGARYPYLERGAGEDVMAAILRPLTLVSH